MAKNNGYSLNLPSLDDLFSTQAEREDAKLEKVVLLLPPEDISEFPNHPFQVRMDDAMKEMVQSVRENGVLVPALVRPKEGGGIRDGVRPPAQAWRRSWRGWTGNPLHCPQTSPMIRQAIVIMVDSNLQREQILPSEKAFAYKMKLDAMTKDRWQAAKG